MKLIVAVIQPTKLQAVQEVLNQLNVQRMTLCDAQEMADFDHPLMMYQGGRLQAKLLRKVVLQIVVNDDFLDRTLQAIRTTACTRYQSTSDDGMILVMPVDAAYQFHPLTEGPGAV